MRRTEEEMAHIAKPREVQQEWRRSSEAELRKRVEEYCGKRMPKGVYLLELGWCMEEVIVMYMQYKRCGEKKCHVKENRRQAVIKDRQK